MTVVGGAITVVCGLECEVTPIPTPRQQQIQNGTVKIDTQQIKQNMETNI